MKKRIEMIVAYDGTDYCGWQRQPNGITIEEVLNRELSRLLKEDIQVIGASRTDSGVHAEANRCIFDTQSRIPADKLCFALNESLPPDIRIRSSRQVPLDFHPRKRNSVKSYVYRVWNDRTELPTRRRYAHFVYVPLDVDKMRHAAACLVGEHDFTSFCSRRTEKEDKVRTLYRADIVQDGHAIDFYFSGSGFLFNMVRIIVGTLLKVGMGVYPPEEVERILEARDRARAGQTAPVRGLTMLGIEYEEQLAEQVHRENRHYSYTVYQDRILSQGVMYCVFERCEEAEYVPARDRLALHAFRNGAARACFGFGTCPEDVDSWEILEDERKRAQAQRPELTEGEIDVD